MNLEKACKIFNIPTTNVSLDLVKQTFRLLALKFHPDKNFGKESEVNEKYTEITTAYHFLQSFVENQKPVEAKSENDP